MYYNDADDEVGLEDWLSKQNVNEFYDCVLISNFVLDSALWVISLYLIHLRYTFFIKMALIFHSMRPKSFHLCLMIFYCYGLYESGYCLLYSYNATVSAWETLSEWGSPYCGISTVCVHAFISSSDNPFCSIYRGYSHISMNHFNEHTMSYN